jgi:hypothetical protein
MKYQGQGGEDYAKPYARAWPKNSTATLAFRARNKARRDV